jgi:uncharacterized protein YndB with AHSA1/START domain
MPRTDRGSRMIAASPERVWAALVDPRALLAWLPPGEMTGRFARFEGRPGGPVLLPLRGSAGLHDRHPSITIRPVLHDRVSLHPTQLNGR